MRAAHAGFVLLLTGLPLTAVAAPRQVPMQEDICVANVVDKRKLAEFLLDGYGVTRSFEGALPAASDDRYQALPGWKRLFVDPQPCAACSKEFKDKYRDDLKGIDAAVAAMSSLLRDQREAYRNATGTDDPAVFLTDDRARLDCLRNAGGVAIEAPGAVKGVPKSTIPLRVRGTTDGLFFDRTDGQFKSLDPATVSFAQNGISGTQMDKLTIVIGYPFTFSGNQSTQTAAEHFSYQVIPYVATNRNVSHTKDKPTVTNTETVNAGVLNAFYYPLIGTSTGRQELVLGNWFTGRADHLWNLQDDSRLFTLGLTYMPVRNGWLNDYFFLVPGRNDLLSLRPILDARADFGVYTDRGTENRNDHDDFIRLGGQMGFALSSDNPDFPLDLLVTYTYLAGVEGPPDKIDYWKTSLTWALDAKRYFTFGVSYSNGRRQDTAQREQLWTVGFNAKY